MPKSSLTKSPEGKKVPAKLGKALAVAFGVVVIVVSISIIMSSIGRAGRSFVVSRSTLFSAAPTRTESFAYRKGAVNIAMDSVAGGAVVGQAAPVAAAVPAQPIDRKIVKNGYVSMSVSDADKAANQFAVIAEQAGGFVEESSMGQADQNGRKSGDVSLRVPADKFSETMEEIRGVARQVEQESVSAQDITAQYVDLDASLKNLKAEEDQYRAIMKEATKVADTLEVAARLADVRGRIERTQAALNLLSKQSDLATIRVHFSSIEAASFAGIVWRPENAVKQNFARMLAGLTDFADGLIAFAIMLPVIALRLAVVVLAVWLAWKIVRAIYRKSGLSVPGA